MKNYKFIKLDLFKNKLNYFDYIFFIKLYNINNLKFIKNEFNSIELVSFSLLKHLNINSKGFFLVIYTLKEDFINDLKLILNNKNLFLNYIYSNNCFYKYTNLNNLNLLNLNYLNYILNKNIINLNWFLNFNYIKLILLLNKYKEIKKKNKWLL